MEIAGAYAMFDGVGSPLTQTFGAGVFEDFLAPEFVRAEEFFQTRGSAVHHEVCSLAVAATTKLLTSRGYRPIEESVVLTRPTSGGAHPSSLTVREIDPAECDRWAALAAEGWSSVSPDLAAFVNAFGQVSSRARGMHCFVAEERGKPIATASLSLASDVALLAGASTIPSARRRGAQQALLQARLAIAAARGAELAMVVAQPESASLRNAERHGFVAAYTRAKWELTSREEAGR